MASNQNVLKLGVYQHYKGNRYEVVGVATHTETGELLVMYRPLYDSDVEYWVRPLAMFTEQVKVEGKTQPRFVRIA